MDVDMDENNLEYWKDKYEALNEEYNEFQTDSQELEAELEKDLAETKSELAAINRKFNQLKHEHEIYKERLEQEVLENKENIETLESSNLDMMNKDEYNVACIRQLEQTVDDLDRAKRQALATICTLENQLADELERNALLEADMDAQKELEAECHRLRDQAKDLSQDLMRHKKRESKLDSYGNMNNSFGSKIDSSSDTSMASPGNALGLGRAMTTSGHLRKLSTSSQPQSQTSQSSPAPLRGSSIHRQGSSRSLLEKENSGTSEQETADGEAFGSSETRRASSSSQTARSETGKGQSYSLNTVAENQQKVARGGKKSLTLGTGNTPADLNGPPAGQEGLSTQNLAEDLGLASDLMEVDSLTATIPQIAPISATEQKTLTPVLSSLNGQRPTTPPSTILTLQTASESKTVAGGGGAGSGSMKTSSGAASGTGTLITTSQPQPSGQETEFQKLMMKSQNSQVGFSGAAPPPLQTQASQMVPTKHVPALITQPTQMSETHATSQTANLQIGMHQNRQSAVNLVGDLLNKIGVLENKLSSCRRFIRDSPWRESSKTKRNKHDKSDQNNHSKNNENSLNSTPSRSRYKQTSGKDCLNNKPLQPSSKLNSPNNALVSENVRKSSNQKKKAVKSTVI